MNMYLKELMDVCLLMNKVYDETLNEISFMIKTFCFRIDAM